MVYFFFFCFLRYTEHFSPIQVLVSSLYKNILAFHPAVFAFLDILNIEKGKQSAKSTFENMSVFVVDFLQCLFFTANATLKNSSFFFNSGGKGGFGVALLAAPPCANATKVYPEKSQETKAKQKKNKREQRMWKYK